MTAFDQIYESSRHNDWSGYLYVAIVIGIATSILLSLVSNSRLRIAAKLIAVLGFTWLATAAAVRENEEKWRIRFQWAEANPDKLTEEDRFAMADRLAINGLFGPMLAGIGAFITLIVANIALFFRRISVVAGKATETTRFDSNGNVNVTASNDGKHGRTKP